MEKLTQPVEKKKEPRHNDRPIIFLLDTYQKARAYEVVTTETIFYIVQFIVEKTALICGSSIVQISIVVFHRTIQSGRKPYEK